jgi:hypothetical protein
MNHYPRLHGQRRLMAGCSGEAPLIALVLGFLVPMLVACATVDTMSTAYIGAPHPLPTDPAHVAILREPPTQAHDGLGEVVVDASTQPPAPIEQIENKLRTEAAKMGADAIVVVVDRVQPVGVYVYGPWSADPVLGRRVVGVAINYRT